MIRVACILGIEMGGAAASRLGKRIVCALRKYFPEGRISFCALSTLAAVDFPDILLLVCPNYDVSAEEVEAISQKLRGLVSSRVIEVQFCSCVCEAI